MSKNIIYYYYVYHVKIIINYVTIINNLNRLIFKRTDIIDDIFKYGGYE